MVSLHVDGGLSISFGFQRVMMLISVLSCDPFVDGLTFRVSIRNVSRRKNVNWGMGILCVFGWLRIGRGFLEISK